MIVGVKELEALHQTMSRLEQRWNVLPTPDATEFFAYDPLPIAMFLEGLRAALPHTRGSQFLDIGCGIGSKLAFMYYLGWQVEGIDKCPQYIEAAQELVPSAQLTVADARHVQSFEADLVYMYRLAVSNDRERQIEEHIVNSVKPGAVVFFPTTVLRDDVPSHLRPIASGIWLVES